VKRLGHEVDHSLPSSADVMNAHASSWQVYKDTRRVETVTQEALLFMKSAQSNQDYGGLDM